MKVNIGPYVEYIGPYQIAEKLFFWVKKYDENFNYTEEYNRVHEFGKFLAGSDEKENLLTRTCNWINSFKKRKMKIRIDKHDTWNMDSTLALIILPMLRQLKETKHGSAQVQEFEQTSESSAQYCFDFYAEGDDYAWERGHKHWEEILDEIIWTFEQLQPDYDWSDQYWITKPVMDLSDNHEDKDEMTHSIKWLVKGECDYEGRKNHQDRIDRGLMLFGKYYQSLWD